MSGSRGPLSKDPSARRRQNPTNAKVLLPIDGYDGPFPDWPLDEASEMELYRWERLWRTPQAAQWVRMHIDFMIARYIRTALLAEQLESKMSVALSNVHGEARQLEDRLGLNPQALKRLEWEVVADELEDRREPEKPQRRRLKAVDTEESA